MSSHRITRRLTASWAGRARLCPRFGPTALLCAALLLTARGYAPAQPAGPSWPDEAWRLKDLAFQHLNRGEYDRAEPLLTRALGIIRERVGEQNLPFAEVANALGVLYIMRHDLDRAEGLFRQSLAARQQALGDGHPDTLKSMGNLGSCLMRKGDYARAETYLGWAAERTRKVVGEVSLDYASRTGNLGLLYMRMGDYGRAEPLLRRDLEIRKEVQGASHPGYLGSALNLGLLYVRMGDAARTEPLLVEAHGGFRSAFGGEHYRMAEAVYCLARLHLLKKDLPRAADLVRQALLILEKSGSPDPNMADTVELQGQIAEAQGDPKAAEACFARALAVREKVLPAGHPELINGLHRYATFLRSQGKADEAAKLETRANDGSAP